MILGNLKDVFKAEMLFALSRLASKSIVFFDDQLRSIHSAELRKCQRELLAANSWAEAFKDRADKLQFALSTMIKEKNPVLASPRIPTKVNLLQETVDTKNSTDGKLLALSGYSPVSAMKQQCTNEQLLTPSGSSQTTQVINSKNSTDRRLLAPSGSSSVYTMKQLSTNEELLAPSGSSQIAQDVGSKKFTDGPLLAPSGTPPECTMKQKCTNEQLSTPSGSSQITQIGASKVIPSGIPFISLTNKPFAFHPNCAKLLRGKWTRVSRLPEPIKANAAINRKKRKMIVDSTRSQEQAASLPSHPLSDGSCSENTFSAVTDLSNGAAYARPEHIDPACTSTALATPPSVNKPTTLRTRNALIECKVRKPLFQDDEDDEDKRKASELA